MNLTGIINDIYNNTKFLIITKKLEQSPVIQSVIKKLIDFYEEDANVTYKSNENYYFLHNKTLNIIKQYTELLNNIIKDNSKEDSNLLKEKLIIIKEKLNNLENELIIHYIVINKLEAKNDGEVKELLIKQIEILLCNYNYILKEKSIIIKILQKLSIKKYQSNKDYDKEYLELIKKIEDTDIISIEKNKVNTSILNRFAQLEIKLQLLFQEESNVTEIFQKYLELIEEIEQLYNSDSEEVLSKINNVISLFIITKKYSNNKLPDYIWKQYKNVLNIKYNYLSKYPEKRILYPPENDYYADKFYKEIIVNSKYQKNTKIQKIILEILTKKIDISKDNDYLLLLSYKNSNCLKEYFQLKESKHILSETSKILLDANGIYLKDEIPLDTMCVIMSKFTSVTKYDIIYELYKADCQESGYKKPILEGIMYTDNFQLIKELLTIAPEYDVIISSDNETFSVNGKIKEKSSNIILEDGIKEVDLPNLKFSNKISIEIPPSVEKLKLNIHDGNYNEIIFKDYINSKILTERWMRIVIYNYFIIQQVDNLLARRFLRKITGTIDEIEKTYVLPIVEKTSTIEDLNKTLEKEMEILLSTFEEKTNKYLIKAKLLKTKAE